MYLYLRGNVVERITERQPGVVAGYQVMPWDGDAPALGQIWNAETQAFEDAPVPVVELPQTHRSTMTPPEFFLLLTAQERVAIRAARASDPVIDDWLTILEDPRLTEVNVVLTATQDGIDYLASQGHMTTARATEIKQGWPL